MIRAVIEDDVAFRVSQLTGKPLTKGFNKQVIELCDEVEKLRKINPGNSEAQKNSQDGN